MNPRTFLIHGLIAGLLAGFAAFLVASTVGEPPLDAAIAFEERSTAHEHADAAAPGHQHDAGDAVVSRGTQSTWGLLTGTVAIGTAMGGLVALAAAGALGRIGRLRPTQSTALVAAIGFAAVALVPFLKYPASPPAVGDPGTLGERTGLYFGFLALSVIAATAATALTARLIPGLGTYRAVLVGTGSYLVVVIVAAQLLPTVNELGDFPAETLWSFRRAALTTLATMWAAIGVVLVGLVGRASQRESLIRARRDLVASL